MVTSNLGSKRKSSAGKGIICFAVLVSDLYDYDDRFGHCIVLHRILVLLFPYILLGTIYYHQAASCEGAECQVRIELSCWALDIANLVFTLVCSSSFGDTGMSDQVLRPNNL